MCVINVKRIDLRHRYQRFAAEEFVLQSGGALCPQPGCGAGNLPDDKSDRRVVCVECRFVFCKNCHQGIHMGDCQEHQQQEAAAAAAAAYSSSSGSGPESLSSWVAIRMSTKPCPKCRTPTERDGGCMHMACSKCGLEWCWVCQTQWTRNCMASHWFG